MKFKRIPTQLSPARPDFTWHIPSKSEKGLIHVVGFSEKEGWVCDCVYFMMSGKKKTCKHIVASKILANNK